MDQRLTKARTKKGREKLVAKWSMTCQKRVTKLQKQSKLETFIKAVLERK